jgi:hypothetical protein
MNNKQFDCIKMKNEIQRQIYDETKNMSVKELLRYFNNKDKSKEEPDAQTRPAHYDS